MRVLNQNVGERLAKLLVGLLPPLPELGLLRCVRFRQELHFGQQAADPVVAELINFIDFSKVLPGPSLDAIAAATFFHHQFVDVALLHPRVEHLRLPQHLERAGRVRLVPGLPLAQQALQPHHLPLLLRPAHLILLLLPLHPLHLPGQGLHIRLGVGLQDLLFALHLLHAAPQLVDFLLGRRHLALRGGHFRLQILDPLALLLPVSCQGLHLVHCLLQLELQVVHLLL
mmetsp:Transcript_6875/g.17784  ORF Transcript_6875/g.17784 Transcript_6875/m.17784 type:complete len:228 (-) Transcript_6875:32-715(-)